MIRGLLAGAAAFLLLALAGALVTDAGTDTLEATNRAWLVVCAIAGLVAGALGLWLARGAARPARYGAAIAGPAALALLFALTTDAADAAGPWFAFAISVAAATLGAFAAERATRGR